MREADPTTQLPGSVHLSGCDWFLLALDRATRSAGPSSNTCRLVLRLGGHLDAATLRQAMASSGLLQWMARIRHVSRTPLFLPAWIAGRPNGLLSVSERDAPFDPSLDGQDDAERPGIRLDRAPCLGFELLQHPDATSSMVLSWHHAIMDAHGAEYLLRGLGHDGSGDRALDLGSAVVANPPTTARNVLRDFFAFPNRLKICKRSARYICDVSAQAAIARLMDRSEARGRRRESFSRQISFDRDETVRIDARAAEMGAGFRKSLFYLAGAVRAVHAVLKRRGRAEGDFLVPVPRDSRKRGARGPVVTNQSSFLFYRVRPEETGNLATLIESLGRQMKEQIRDDMPRLILAMMSQFRRIPLAIYSRLLRGPTKGQLASFYFSDTGEVCEGLERFLGLPVTGIAHLPAPTFPPGLTAAFTRYQGRQQAVVSWTEGCLDGEEMALFERCLRRDLLEGGRE